MIVIMMGSKADYEFSKKIGDALAKFGADFEYRVASAHKTPEIVLDIIAEYEKQFSELVFITVAGRSNGLSGVVAANSFRPVIACPPLEDKDAYMIDIHSTLRMPSGTPSLTVIDPVNAALAAARILGLCDAEIATAVQADIAKRKDEIRNAML